MHRFYQPKETFFGNYIVSADKKLISQLSKVLRAKEGGKFGIFNGDGKEYIGQLVALEKSQAKFLIIDDMPNFKESKNEVILYASLLKSDKYEWLLQKATELGVSRIVPVASINCVVKDLSEAKRRRYEDIIKEAVEQCGGARFPALDKVTDFAKAIKQVSEAEGDKYIAHEKIDGSYPETNAGIIHVFVGPEGGFSEVEIEQAQTSGILPISLGRRVLRAETAGIVAVAKFVR